MMKDKNATADMFRGKIEAYNLRHPHIDKAVAEHALRSHLMALKHWVKPITWIDGKLKRYIKPDLVYVNKTRLPYMGLWGTSPPFYSRYNFFADFLYRFHNVPICAAKGIVAIEQNCYIDEYVPFITMYLNGMLGYIIGEKEIVCMSHPAMYPYVSALLHRIDGPAVAWPTELYYYLHGIRVSEKTVLSPEKITKEDILNEKSPAAQEIMVTKIKNCNPDIEMREFISGWDAANILAK